MNLAYMPRLLCLSMAALFLLHLTLGLLVSLMAGAAVRFAESMRPHVAARLLLILRLLPAAGAAVVVMLVCLPSYLWLEPDAPSERVGIGCVAVAMLGCAMWGNSITRGLRAASGSRRFLENCGRTGHRMRLRGDRVDVWIVEGGTPLLALAGIWRPRLVVSRGVVNALTGEQLAAALRHERAHWASRDNLKRLAMLLTPGVLPFGGRGRLERSWRKFTEWAADDRAVDGNARRSYALAEALVRVARMNGDAPDTALAAMLLGDADQLAARVERLLSPRRAAERKRPVLAVSACMLMATALAVAVLQPAALNSVHLALEHLVG